MYLALIAYLKVENNEIGAHYSLAVAERFEDPLWTTFRKIIIVQLIDDEKLALDFSVNAILKSTMPFLHF